MIELKKVMISGIYDTKDLKQHIIGSMREASFVKICNLSFENRYKGSI